MAAGVWNEYAQGYREIVYFVPEPDAAYGIPVHPAPTDACQITTTSFVFSQERVNREDKTSSRSYRGRIPHRKEVSWSCNMYNLPSGTNQVAPDAGVALEAGVGETYVIADKTLTAGSTTTVIKLSSATGLRVGDCLGWLNPAGAVNEIEASFITNIAVNDVTVMPPYSAAPTTGVMKGCVMYRLAGSLNTMTITRLLDNIVQVYPGCFVNDVSWDFPGTEEGTLTVGGQGKTEYASGTGTLAVAALVGDLTLTVTRLHGDRYWENTRVQCENEVMLITRVQTNTGVAPGTDILTVIRAQAGTTAASHAIGLEIGPYEPVAVTAGEPISGTTGDFFIIQDPLAYPGTPPKTRANYHYCISTASIAINNNGTLRNECFGTDSAEGVTFAKREVSFSIGMWLQKQQAALYNRAKKFEASSIIVQLGKFLGSTNAHFMPKADFTVPEIPGGGDEAVTVTFEGVAVSSLAGIDDELFVAYL